MSLTAVTISCVTGAAIYCGWMLSPGARQEMQEEVLTVKLLTVCAVISIALALFTGGFSSTGSFWEVIFADLPTFKHNSRIYLAYAVSSALLVSLFHLQYIRWHRDT